MRVGLSLGFFIALLFTTPVYAVSAVSVDVPDHCSVVDSDGVSHSYGPGQYLGICALQAAIDAGSVTGVSFSNAFPAFGLFVTSIQGVAANPESQYWALYQNSNFALLGISQLPVAAGDSITLELHNFSDEALGHDLTLNIHSLISSAPVTQGSRSIGLTLHDPFNTQKAVQYLESVQKKDGSFGSDLLNDWVAIMTGTGRAGDLRARLASFLVSHPPTLVSVTDYERHAMALQALGIDPYSGTSVDTISPIVRAFDGTQIGDPSLVNDDIFAIFPLMHAGYESSEELIQKTAAFIMARQSADGSWLMSIDLTAAAIQALVMVEVPGTEAAIKKATAFLRAHQNTDGGFGSSQSTSWALLAINAIGETPFEWSGGTYKMPDYYVATKQEIDGGVEPQTADTLTRAWATAYAIPAMERATWDSLLQDFPKPQRRMVDEPAPEPHAAPLSPESPKELDNEPAQIENVVSQTEAAPSTETDAVITANAQVAAAAAVLPKKFNDPSGSLWAIGLLLVLLGWALLYLRRH